MQGSWLRSIVLQRSQRVNFFVIRVICPLFSKVSPQVAQRSLETVGDRTSVTFLNTSEYVLSSHSSPPLSMPLGSFYFWYLTHPPGCSSKAKIRQFLAINRKFADTKKWGNEAIDPMTQVIWQEVFDVRGNCIQLSVYPLEHTSINVIRRYNIYSLAKPLAETSTIITSSGEIMLKKNASGSQEFP